MVNDRIDDPGEADVDYYVGLEHIDSDSLTIRRWGSPSDVEATKLRFRAGDIIFGRRRVYQRKLAVAHFDGICSAHAIVLRAKPDVVIPEFLPFFMQSDIFMERAKEISVGSLSPTINWKSLAKEEFALPPPEEQRRIAGSLMSMQRAIDFLEDASGCGKSMRRSLLRTLMSPRSAWRETTVGEVARVVGGGTPSTLRKDFWNGDIPWLTPAEVVRANGGLISDSERKISEDGLKNSSAQLLPEGAVLLTTRATIGAVAIAARQLTTNQGFQSLIPNAETSSRFLFYWCQDNVAQMVARASGSTFLEISGSSVRKMRLALPHKRDQEAIVASMETVDASLAGVGERISRLKELKRTIFKHEFRDGFKR